jgi:hypothetical protein
VRAAGPIFVRRMRTVNEAWASRAVRQTYASPNRPRLRMCGADLFDFIHGSSRDMWKMPHRQGSCRPSLEHPAGDCAVHVSASNLGQPHEPFFDDPLGFVRSVLFFGRPVLSDDRRVPRSAFGLSIFALKQGPADPNARNVRPLGGSHRRGRPRLFLSDGAGPGRKNLHGPRRWSCALIELQGVRRQTSAHHAIAGGIGIRACKTRMERDALLPCKEARRIHVRPTARPLSL